MSSIRNYFFIGIAVLVGLNFLVNLPSYLFYGSKYSSPSALAEVDLREPDILKKAISQGYNAGGFFALVTYVSGRHNGVDFAAKHGSPIYSPISGKVVALGNQDDYCYRRNYGKFMVIENSEDGAALLFAHLSKIKADVGDEVSPGDNLALVGSTGKATAPHLHFTVFAPDTFEMIRRKDCGPNPAGDDINPLKYLRAL
ncbi:MAG: M23 family metallopeptidase [Patescibacteria group bacterium]